MWPASRAPFPPVRYAACLLFGIACGPGGGQPDGDGSGDGGAAGVGDRLDTDEHDDALVPPELPLGAPIATTDVVIVGAGAAGMAAAWEAIDAGADVILIERESSAGGSSDWAGRMWAAGTTLQATLGIEDSADLALEEWPDFTNGDPEDPLVGKFVYESAETIEWLESFGMIFGTVGEDPETGSVARIHEPRMPGPVTAMVLVEELEPVTWLDTEGGRLVIEDGRVIGVRVHDLVDDSTGWIEAGAVVMATGGMVRNEDRLLAAAPALSETGWVNEAFPFMDGNGLDTIAAAGGALSNLDSVGVYAHAVDDPRFDHAGAAMVVLRLSSALVVNTAGERVMDEDDTRAFGAGRTLVENGGLYAIVDAPLFALFEFMASPFDWGVDDFEDIPDPILSSSEYADLVDVPNSESLGHLAELLAMDPDVLEASVDRYNTMVDKGVDTDFGKEVDGMPVLSRPPWYAIELRPGPSKSYGGATLGINTEVLGLDGEPIPGLYAAGEVAGVLGGEGVGWGFSGSITACWWGGRVAGQAAAGDALARRGAR